MALGVLLFGSFGIGSMLYRLYIRCHYLWLCIYDEYQASRMPG